MGDQPFDRSRLVDIVSGYWPARAVLTGQALGVCARCRTAYHLACSLRSMSCANA